MNIKIKTLSIYPLKSAKGIERPKIQIDEHGPRYDREWMLVKKGSKNFVSQRTHPELSQVSTLLTEDALVVSHAKQQCLSIPLERTHHLIQNVKIFSKENEAEIVGDYYDQWFSELLKTPVQLVRSLEKSQRQTSAKYGAQSFLRFADGFPLLLTNVATLDELNSRLPSPITMNRFRPNIVIDGIHPNIEDSWKKLKINGVEFNVAKSCTRCSIIDIDPQNGSRSKQVSSTLKDYRTKEGQIIFGINLNHLEVGEISVDDQILSIR